MLRKMFNKIITRKKKNSYHLNYQIGEKSSDLIKTMKLYFLFLRVLKFDVWLLLKPRKLNPCYYLKLIYDFTF